MNYFRESFGCLSCLFQVWKFSKVEFEKLSDFAPLMLSEFIEMFSPSCAYFTKLKCWKYIVKYEKIKKISQHHSCDPSCNVRTCRCKVGQLKVLRGWHYTCSDLTLARPHHCADHLSGCHNTAQTQSQKLSPRSAALTHSHTFKQYPQTHIRVIAVI